ncbi:MAG TPA: hypothetical protein PLN21_01850 [Gemmatales bacterium]|nr:hypothetical protein [Gemmatales bacterium]
MFAIRFYAVLLLYILGLPSLRADDIEHDPINYSKATPNNIITQLQERLNGGKTSIHYDDDTGYLKGVLKELKIPLSSQVLVFSKTSMQRPRINPKTPRALYFNDDTYIGFCLHGSVLEVSTTDSTLGTVFYTVDQERHNKPVITRQTDSCLICHASSYNHGLPGHLVRSVYPDRNGEPLLASGSYRTDQTSPFSERWGGWYVTGTHGKQEHLGNRFYHKRNEAIDDSLRTQNVTDLSQHFTVGLYPSPHSDLVALMVLEHQTAMHNRITRATLDTRLALYYQDDMNKSFNEKPGTVFDSTKRRIQSVSDELVRYLLFSGEARLTDPIAGSSTFAQEFSQRGPLDKQGRSLRQFDLKTRLFRYPCSYLIYSESFDGMPVAVREVVLKQLFDTLTGKDQSAAYAHLSPADRKAILEILRETKPNLPDYWRMK